MCVCVCVCVCVCISICMYFVVIRGKQLVFQQIPPVIALVAFTSCVCNVSQRYDLEKVYNTTWKYGITEDVHDFGLISRLPFFLH